MDSSIAQLHAQYRRGRLNALGGGGMGPSGSGCQPPAGGADHAEAACWNLGLWSMVW